MTTPSTTGKLPQDRLKLLYNTHMVTIEVGAIKEHFVVHQSLLCAKSQYFNKALSGSFKEATTRFVQLPDVSPILFRIFVAWIYHDKLIYSPPDKTTIDEDFKSLKITEEDLEQDPILRSEPQNHSSNKEPATSRDSSDDMTERSSVVAELEASGPDVLSNPGPPKTSSASDSALYKEADPNSWSCDVLIKLYIFADRFDVRSLRADSLDALMHAIDRDASKFGLRDIRYIYMNTSANSPLRRFVVHHIAYHHAFSESASSWENYPAEFLAALVVINGRRLPIKLCRDCHHTAILLNGLQGLDIDDVCAEDDFAPYEKDSCFYHEHLNEEERNVCRVRRAS
ncbi:unnamed protein product [Aureobasidium mustum]|uniref:BTB domain-containing protein n=1 Tax=Aureobasidium mustum TaxID=2773714 RepID=A0A9N8JSK0_9PEZI|nr:unnamed protein product [Aureobasidium mustum]